MGVCVHACICVSGHACAVCVCVGEGEKSRTVTLVGLRRDKISNEMLRSVWES